MTTPVLLQMHGVIIDLIYTVETVPAAGQEAMVSNFYSAPGGGFNAMVAARRAGMRVCYGGSVGSGSLAALLRDRLNTESIPALQPPDPARDQGCCTVLIDATGERTFIASEGAEGYLTAQSLARLPFADVDWTLLSGYALHYPGSRAALVDWLRAPGGIARLVFDPSPLIAGLEQAALQAVLARALWVSANAREAAVLTGLDDPRAAALALAADRPEGGGAIVRQGADGCMIAQGTRVTPIAPFEVDAVDTNGAGDTHIGSFIGALAHTGDPVSAARYANAAAALSTTRHGPATAPRREEVETLLGNGLPG